MIDTYYYIQEWEENLPSGPGWYSLPELYKTKEGAMGIIRDNISINRKVRLRKVIDEVIFTRVE